MRKQWNSSDRVDLHLKRSYFREKRKEIANYTQFLASTSKIQQSETIKMKFYTCERSKIRV